jgi:hypothetical protein
MHCLVPSRFGAQRGWPTVLKAIALGNLGGPGRADFSADSKPGGHQPQGALGVGSRLPHNVETEENAGVA